MPPLYSHNLPRVTNTPWTFHHQSTIPNFSFYFLLFLCLLCNSCPSQNCINHCYILLPELFHSLISHHHCSQGFHCCLSPLYSSIGIPNHHCWYWSLEHVCLCVLRVLGTTCNVMALVPT